MLTAQPPITARAHLAPCPAHPTTKPSATAAKSASCCAGVSSTAANGPSNGFPKWPSDAARPQPTFSQQTPGSSGKRATVAQLATGDEPLPCRSTCPAFDCAGCAFPFSRPTPEVTA